MTALFTHPLDGDGLRLCADFAGDRDGAVVIFLHGGGQTRHSWGAALAHVAGEGYHGISVDLRGHGDSDWSSAGSYHPRDHARDIVAILQAHGPAFLVGASLGGIASLLAAAEVPELVHGLILVDVAPKIEPEAADRVRNFMMDSSAGFASLDEAVDAVAAYLPHRPRPRDPRGLLKNLRVTPEGRYRWHWDPALMAQSEGDLAGLEEDLDRAARTLRMPTLLLRGSLSDMVSAAGKRAFQEQVPQSEFVDVSGADHMIAGDRNDVFNSAVIDFLARHLRREPPPSSGK